MSVNCNDLTTAVWVYDIDRFCICWANKTALNFWEVSTLEELKEKDFQPFTSDAVQKTLLDYRETLKRSKTASMFWQYSPKNITKETFCQISNYTLSDGRIGILCEITPAELITANIPQHSMIMLSTYDLQGNFISANPPFKEQMANRITSLDQIFSKTDSINSILDTLEAPHSTYCADCLLETVQGEKWFTLQASLSIEETGKREILVQQFNINERKLEEINLSIKANTDPLTGLLNRRGLDEALAKRIAAHDEFFIFYIDLDSFKMINDSMGHTFGDLVLKTLASRLTNLFFENTIICRFGGDEFILIMRKTEQFTDQKILADRLQEVINKPHIDHDGNPLQVSASVGCALYPKDGDNIKQLLLRADAAMYTAKALGKKRGVHYEKGMENTLQRRSLIARYLYLAIENDELEIRYQPIMDVKANCIHSFEALLHWHNPILGEISPEETIQVAERIGIIIDIEKWVIKKAISDLPMLRHLSTSEASISINISGIHLIDTTLCDYLNQILTLNNLTPSDLIIELTESSLATNINTLKSNVKNLIELGTKLSIDEFGIGYSSLAYLHQVPAKIVKIDKSFTQNFEERSATVMSIHQLLQSLELTSLIEGIETKKQSLAFKSTGIHLQQGPFHGLPITIDDYQGRQKAVASQISL